MTNRAPARMALPLGEDGVTVVEVSVATAILGIVLAVFLGAQVVVQDNVAGTGRRQHERRGPGS